MGFVSKIPIYGSLLEQKKIIEGQAELIESQNAFMQSLIDESKGWNALDKQAGEKDIKWDDYVTNHKDCWDAYVSNPLAKGYVDRLCDFVIKDGFQVTSEDPKTANEIEKYEKTFEPLSFQIQSCREVAIYGEIFDRFFDGIWSTRSVLIDPTIITGIETDPLDVGKVKKYYYDYQEPTYNKKGEVVKTTTRKGSISVDEIIHLKVNTVSQARRGISDLLCNLKWLARHKSLATNLIRRSNIQMSVIGEKIIKGSGLSTTTVGGYKKSGDESTAEESGKRMERQVIPGTFYVHTPNVEYKFTPLPGDTRGMIDLLKMINKVICAGFGLSEHWLGDTSESNLATATSVEIPIIAKFERRQRELKSFFEEHYKKVLEGRGIDNPEFEVIPPELSTKDAVAFAEAIKILAEGVILLVDGEYISKESAAQTVGDYLDYFDSFKDEQKKIEDLKKQGQKKEEKPGGVLPAPFTQDEEMTQKFQQAFTEAKEELHKAAMDGIILDYAKVFSDAFSKAREKVMKVLEDRANERKTQSAP